MKIGLRIDVDTFRGTRVGVPNLCSLLAEHSIKATFFFSVGPDNMGRHLWRLFRPTFLWKMLRTKAARLYGWDILLKGTFWPGPIIGERLGHIIRATAEAGHEIGLHAWDHHGWQAHIHKMDSQTLDQSLRQGVELLTKILGKPPTCSAVPGWKCNERVLTAKENFDFQYNSDCRGKSIFYPLVAGKKLSQPQVPVTLPTYDEIVGCSGITVNEYNRYILSLLSPGKLNVLTIHAEVEGIVGSKLFAEFIETAHSQGNTFVPLQNLLEDSTSINAAAIAHEEIPGREGWVACQTSL